MQLRATRLIACGRGRSAWTPAQIPTALWLDANDTSTITLNGSTVSQWNDKSGNGRNAVQATAANQPGWGVGRNLMLWSEEFQQSSWQRFQVGVTANASTAPNGTLTADKVTGSAASGAHILYQVASIAAAAPHTFVIRAKAAEYQYVTLIGGVEQFGGSAVRHSATVDLSTGTITKTASVGSPISPTASTRALSNGWWEITVSLSSASANTVLQGICPTTTATPTQDGFLNVQYTGDGTSGVLVWGGQVNPGTTADQYQQTTSAAQPLLAGINGKPTLSFDGINDLLGYNGEFLANTNYTVSALHFRSVDKTLNWIFGGTTQAANQNFLMGYEIPSTKFRWGQYANDIDTSGQTYVTGLPSIAIARQSSTDGKNTYINGVAGGFSGNTTPLSSNSGAGIGGLLTNFFNGGIAEIVMTTSALSTADRQRLEGYLAWKWGGF